jgi:beta-fructofuranosidase
MSLFYKPSDGWPGDFIPFYWEGEYHLFYLKDYRNEKVAGPGIPWFHIGTRDFVHFTDYGEAIPRGCEDEQDLCIFTGCVIERGGSFHIFYTGHNASFAKAGRPSQAIMHATSPDLTNWSKDGDMVMPADPDRYETGDWRDPFVLWNDEAGEYWMLIAARLKDGPSDRRGCIALATSEDLGRWEIQDPFWAPGLCSVHEVPDLFRWGDLWYLVYSVFTGHLATHYRVGRSLTGPWTSTELDTFDGRAFYAAKTAGDGERRFAFGWNPTKAGDEDSGSWQWGGNLVVHELTQVAGGGLRVKVPHEVDAVFSTPQATSPRPRMGEWSVEGGILSADSPHGFAWCHLADMPGSYRLDTSVSWSPGTREVGIILRGDDRLETYYTVGLEPGRHRVVFDRTPRPADHPFVAERPLPENIAGEARIKAFVEETIIEVYIDDAVALGARGYDHRGRVLGLFVSEGRASFRDTTLGLL